MIPDCGAKRSNRIHPARPARRPDPLDAKPPSVPVRQEGRSSPGGRPCAIWTCSCVTGLDVPELLRASQIRSWARCETDEQRLDLFNGLLLAPHLDALFDGGWITFSDAGQALISPQLGEVPREVLGLAGSIRIEGLRPEHHAYLEFHRSTLWLR